MRDSLRFWIVVFMIGTKYDFVEQLLERVIRNEFALKDTLDKITATHSKVVDTLKKIDEKEVTLNESVQNQLNSTIKSFVGQTSKALDGMGGTRALHLVMFHARLPSTNPYTYTSGQDLVFQTILVNEGGGYDPNTGRFVASISGVYMFTMQYCAAKDKWARFDIVKGGTPIQRSVHKGVDGACVSMQAFTKVAMGEHVWVRSTYSSEVYQYDEYWNSFAGMLIHV